MIAVDGTHLRGKYPGVLMVAVTFDANKKLFPLAFAFAEAERWDSWEWFLANLSVSLGEPTNLTIVSDRQKDLVPALANIIPSASHCYCCRHLAENIKATFKDPAIVMKFWCAAKAYRACEYEAFMEDIRTISQDAFNYINGFRRQHWTSAFVEGRRYDMLTSNVAECTNSMLKDTRALPIVKQVEEIRARLMEFFQKRHSKNLNINSRLTSYVEKILGHETEEARRLHGWMILSVVNDTSFNAIAPFEWQGEGWGDCMFNAKLFRYAVCVVPLKDPVMDKHSVGREQLLVSFWH